MINGPAVVTLYCQVFRAVYRYRLVNHSAQEMHWISGVCTVCPQGITMHLIVPFIQRIYPHTCVRPLRGKRLQNFVAM